MEAKAKLLGYMLDAIDKTRSSNVELDTPKGGEAQEAGVTHAVFGIHAVQTQHPAVEAKAKLLGYMLDTVDETRSSNVELDTPKGGEAQKAGVTHAVFGIHAVQTQYPAVEAKAKLLGYMLAEVEETRSSHVMRLRKPRPQSRGSSGEMPAQTTCDVAEVQLNPVAGTAGCKQLVPRVVANVMAAHETAYTPESDSIIQLIKALQLEDPWVSSCQQGKEMDNRMANAGSWTWDFSVRPGGEASGAAPNYILGV